MPSSRRIPWFTISLTGILLALIPLLLIQTDTLAATSILNVTLHRVRTKLQPKFLQTLSPPTLNYSSTMSGPKKTPVYFLSHGGPTIMDAVDHPAHAKLREIGREITQQVRPKAVVVFSAHWQAEPDAIEVNTAEHHPLLYDYYGFPPHYYKITYPNTGSPSLAGHVLSLLQSSGIPARGVTRGLDHGVFAPFRVAFDPAENPLGVPIVQVSLFDSDDARRHFALGQAVAKLREEGVLIIVSGMAVHNVREHFRRAALEPGPSPEAVRFDEALREAVETPPGEGRFSAMEALLGHRDARRAHPTFEHLLPIHIGVGAAGEDEGRRFWTFNEGLLGWAQYRFGEVGA